MVWMQKTKWGHAKSQTYLGQKFDSKFEAQEAFDLEAQRKVGKIKGWKAHQEIPLIVNGYKVCSYWIDFVIEHNDGTIEYLETKGMVTSTWALKWKLFCALYEDKPGVKLTVVMQGKYRVPKAKKVKNY